jgi:hypothetical protein
MRSAKCFVLMLATPVLARCGRVPTADPIDGRSASPIASGLAGGAALAMLEDAGVVPTDPLPCPKGIDHCIFLMEQQFNRGGSYLHKVWIMDTTGLEYELRFSKADDDPLRDPGATSITQTEFERAVAQAKAPSRSVKAGEVARAWSWLASSRTGVVEALPSHGCRDGVGTTLNGFWFEEDRQIFSSMFLRSEACGWIQKENSSRSAQMLAQWVDGLRRQRSPRR